MSDKSIERYSRIVDSRRVQPRADTALPHPVLCGAFDESKSKILSDLVEWVPFVYPSPLDPSFIPLPITLWVVPLPIKWVPLPKAGLRVADLRPVVVWKQRAKARGWAYVVNDMWVGRELIDDLSSGSMPDLYTAVGGEFGAADRQHPTTCMYDVCTSARAM